MIDARAEVACTEGAAASRCKHSALLLHDTVPQSKIARLSRKLAGEESRKPDLAIITVGHRGTESAMMPLVVIHHELTSVAATIRTGAINHVNAQCPHTSARRLQGFVNTVRVMIALATLPG